MKLNINYTANKQGVQLNNIDIECDAEEDAEGLGYALCLLESACGLLQTLAKNASPEHQKRILKGINFAIAEQANEGPDSMWPFTKTLFKNEP